MDAFTPKTGPHRCLPTRNHRATLIITRNFMLVDYGSLPIYVNAPYVYLAVYSDVCCITAFIEASI